MTGAAAADLVRFVADARSRWQRLTALRAWSLMATAGAIVLLLALVANRFIAPARPAAVVLWTAAIVTTLVCLGSMIVLLRRRPTDFQVARFVEERCPVLEDVLVTAIGSQHRAVDSAMKTAVLADAANRLRGVDPERVVSTPALRRAVVRAAAATAALLVAIALAADPIGRATRFAAIFLFPRDLALQVSPGDLRISAGEAVRIVARVASWAEGIVPVLRVADGERWYETEMEPADDGFTFSFDRVERGFKYKVTAAGTATNDFTVTVLHPPHVERIDLRYDYPAAFRMAPRLEEDSGDIYGPPGTKVRITVVPDKPISEGSLTLAGAAQPLALVRRGDVLEGTLTITNNGSYRVALADEEGLRNPGDTEYFIRTLTDRPPSVRIVRPASDRQATAIEEVTIEARADDDFGIAAFELVYSVRGGPERVAPFERGPTSTTVDGRQILYLEEFDLKAGDVVTYYARVRDVGRGKPSSEARSDIFFIEVTPFEEEFEASQGAASPDEEAAAELVQAEKDIITATWNLDRRGREAGGRADADIRTVARGQRDLRTRVIDLLARLRRAAALRRLQPGGRGQATGADDVTETLSVAIDAMSQAQAHLDALSTADALPDEMAALNALLLYQEQTRQRQQVGQQQTNGAGANAPNRQQVDLSSLFDRELSRQQQTNYENRPTTDARGDSAQRLGDLARRQDELARQQEELARARGNMTPEEVRRELERLTREQNELRQQAEELAQQLERNGRSGGGARQDEIERQLREATQEMQGAAGDLRREDPRQASGRSSRAAEQLRELEQQLRGGDGDERRQALNQLQLESRQLAEAQRRLTAEQQAGREGDRSPTERATEQERLADRAQRLEEQVRQLASAAPAAERQEAGAGAREREALTEAARDLDQERISERMRAAAQAERQAAAQSEGQANNTSADPATRRRESQEIAQALDDLAGDLATAAGQSQEEQQFTAELERLRQRREELEALSRELEQLRQQSADAGQTMQQARELAEALQKESGLGLTPTDTQFNPGLSAPGTEAWKQDFARWDELKVQLGAALEHAERTAADRLRNRLAADRLNAGAAQTVPEKYRQLVDRYFRSLAAPATRGR